MNTSGEHRVSTHSPDQTRQLAASLAADAGPDTVLALHGELGSGKTCFAQGFAEGMGIHDPVTSPTFTLVNEYNGRLPLFHIDLYRIHNTEELTLLDLSEFFNGGGVTLIEWAERARDMLPPNTIHVFLEPMDNEDERSVVIRYPEPSI